MATEAIDKKYLKGLKFRSSTPEKTENGVVHTPTSRALTPEDVLDWKDNGATVTIVAADGKKYVVDKNAKPEEPAKKE